MVNLFDAPSGPEPLSMTAILDKFKADQAALSELATPKINGSNSDGYQTINPGVFDRFADLAEWSHSLQPRGWERTKPPDSATLEAWRRPGGTHPVSAKVLKANRHVLVNWSEDSGLPVGAGQKLTKARLHAHLYYRGDESAFAKDLVRGQAQGVPAHINQVFRAEWEERPTNVTEMPPGDPASTESAETGSEAVSSSWRPVDLTSVLDGTWRPPEPSIGRRSDGQGLFYPGKTHTVVSETEAGKTWFALAAAIHEMAAGCHVFYIDFEDDQGSVVGRLLNLGVDPEAIREMFHYIRPEHPLKGIHFDVLCRELATYSPSLALVDGITEAMTLHGLNPIDNTDIAVFNRQVIAPLTASGAGQVSFDHVVKDKEGRGRYALGGVHKLNIVSGAGYTLENRQPFGIGLTGRSTIKIAKDRPGQLRANALPGGWYGDLVLASNTDGTAEVTIESSQERVAERDATPFRPTNLMEKISKYLEGEGEADSQNDILKGVPGNRDGKIAALRILKEEGYVTPAKPYESLKPYRASDEK
jgi:hypothetical protein